MGFREPDSTITVRFEPGHIYHGLEATLRSMTIEEYAAALGWDGGEGDSQGQTLERFYKALISWNLTDSRDQPIPVSEARHRDKRLILALNNAWVESLTGVHSSDPLPDSSTSGENSPAPAIPMAPLSESQAS
ncbi:hypothetical protein ACH4ZX_03930 [Streptomyces sp. NPDC020490]|uniref:hypothetical protein n=1 Tax=Streptomyces sp. NPDC020490 TaxID=3365078 RepID=UPI0037A2DDD0